MAGIGIKRAVVSTKRRDVNTIKKALIKNLTSPTGIQYATLNTTPLLYNEVKKILENNKIKFQGNMLLCTFKIIHPTESFLESIEKYGEITMVI